MTRQREEEKNESVKEYILEYLADRGQDPVSWAEQKRMEMGIERYLLENGIEADTSGTYYKRYVTAHLCLISAEDLKQYFLNYETISETIQIVLEYRCEKTISKRRKQELYQLTEKLYLCGLGEKYVPVWEIRKILGESQ